jgi:hypothetical protein
VPDDGSRVSFGNLTFLIKNETTKNAQRIFSLMFLMFTYIKFMHAPAGLDIVEKRKVSHLIWESNPDSSILQPVA